MANWRVTFTKLVYYGRMEVKELESYLLINLLGNYIYSTFFAIFIYGRDDIVMPWWGNLIAYIVPSVLTCLVTLYISRKSQVNTNTETLFKLVHQLKSHKKKISEDIGKTPNDKTLTGQHKDLQELLKKEINTVERRYTEEENRIRTFNLQQHDMLQTITQFRLFMDSWTRISEDNNKLNLRINQLEQKIAEQTKENEKLKNHISALENENRKLKSKIQYISNPQNHRSGDDDREI